jgi:N,N'-diacetyllegionaminate synthase
MKVNKIKIDDNLIKQNSRTFIIAEIGQTHEGSLGLAYKLIDAAADCNADAVKFQMHIASEESTLDEKFRIKFSFEDKTRYDYWKRMEFTDEQWKGLFLHANKRGITFLCSAFSIKSVEVLNKIGVSAWKVGSGELSNFELIKAMIKTKKPILLSTGMSSWDEIDKTVNYLNNNNTQYALFQCTSKYPSKFGDVGLNLITEMHEKFGAPVGLSDHSGSIFPSIAAMAIGASVLEVHITPSEYMFGPDIKSSISLQDLKLIVDARDAFIKIFNSKVDKDQVSKELNKMRKLFHKSLTLIKDQSAGTIINENNITLKKPGTGISIEDLQNVLGKELKKDVSSKRLLKWTDIKNQKDK